jgi:hypothetical protein
MQSLDKARAQVHVEEMQYDVTRKQQVGVKASASFPMAPGEAVILADLDEKTAQSHVAVSSSVKRTAGWSSEGANEPSRACPRLPRSELRVR